MTQESMAQKQKKCLEEKLRQSKLNLVKHTYLCEFMNASLFMRNL